MHGRDSSQKPFLANVRAASPSVARGAGFANLVAAVAILVALFPPFVNQHCSVCTAAVAATLPVGALGRGADGWVFIWLGCLVGITAIGFLLGIGSRLAAIVNGVSSLAALALAIFEGASAFPRVVADAQLVRGMGSLTWTLDSGFYLLLSAALLAVVTTLIMNVLPKQEGFELSLKSFGTREHGGRSWMGVRGVALCGWRRTAAPLRQIVVLRLSKFHGRRLFVRFRLSAAATAGSRWSSWDLACSPSSWE